MTQHIVIAAANGFLGKSLIQYFSKQYNIVCLVRSPQPEQPNVRFVLWDGKQLGAWSQELEGAKAIINLAGRSINCRYTEHNKKDILQSRIDSTRVIGETIEQCIHKPAVWFNCSSITLYEHSFTEAQDEYATTRSSGFSTDVCLAWEQAFNEFSWPEVRGIILRISVVLGKKEGALKPLVPITKLGLGGASGSGKQLFSWIHVADFCAVVDFLLHRTTASGAFNVCSPKPVTNKAFMGSLRKALRIPFGLWQPAWVVQLGAMFIGTEAELVLESRYVVPTRLIEQGFQFKYPEIQGALNSLV